jgi:peptidyl-prolyl cis-trans isomerase NIMA-interacting 1
MTLPSNATLAALALFACAGCTAIASTPSWTGGSLASGAPLRIAEQEAAIEREREEAARAPKTIGAKHILVMHADSQRKPPNVTRTKAEAKKRAQDCLREIRGGADFDEMVGKCSDEPGAAERNGDLGVFERTVMVKAFGDAAFSLRVGEVSEVVETPFGFHVIKRTE